MNDQREKLIELLKDEKCPYTSGLFTDEDVADYLLANGVVVLPCKVGDAVFRINKNLHTHVRSISETKVSRVAIDSEGTWIFCECIPTSKSKFGEIVFLTREEAERALKGGGAK